MPNWFWTVFHTGADVIFWGILFHWGIAFVIAFRRHRAKRRRRDFVTRIVCPECGGTGSPNGLGIYCDLCGGDGLSSEARERFDAIPGFKGRGTPSEQ